MTRSQLLAALAMSALLSACGGNDTKEVDCEEGLKYQNRVEGRRVVAPDDLDQLEDFREMPIPKADPEAPQPAPGECDDMPPAIGTGK